MPLFQLLRTSSEDVRCVRLRFVHISQAKQGHRKIRLCFERVLVSVS